MRTFLRWSIWILAALVTPACGRAEKEAAPVVPVQVSPAIRGSIRQIVTADAVIFPRDQASITPKIVAPVARFLVQRGDHVRQGQLLAVLENRDLVATVAASKGQYGEAESNYRSTSGAAVPEQVIKAQADVDATREALDAAKKLLDSREQLAKEGAIARKQVDEARVAYVQAKAQFDTAEEHAKALHDVSREEQIKLAAAQLEAARGQYEGAQSQVAYSEIRSPIAGVVTDRPLYAGEMANPGAPLLTVMDMASVVARVNVTQEQATNVRVGCEATLSAADGSEPIAGAVTVVSPAVDPNSTTVQVWVQARNPGERLRVGTSVHVAIVAATIDGAVLIPASAILPSEEGGSKVMVVDDKGVAHEKKITVGVREEDLVQVLAGVEPDDRVVTVGGLGLEDKATVRVLKPGEKGPGKADDEDDKDEK